MVTRQVTVDLKHPLGGSAVQSLLALVRITHEQFVDLRSQINVKEELDTGPTLAVSGVHPELGQVVLFDSTAGGRVAAVSHEKVHLVS